MADPVAAAPAAPAPPAAAPAAPAAALAASAAPATAPPAAPAAAAPTAAPAAEPLVDLFAEPATEGKTKPEDKPADGKPAEGEPPVYDLKLPDGLELTDEQLSGVQATLAAAKVPPDQAQALFDEYLGAMRTASEQARQAGLDGWTNTQREWQATIKADPDIGGAKLEATIAQTRKGAEKLLGTEAAKELFTALNITGAGNNPAIVKSLFKAFSMHAPATQVSGAPAGTRETRSAGATLYPKQVGLGNANIN